METKTKTEAKPTPPKEVQTALVSAEVKAAVESLPVLKPVIMLGLDDVQVLNRMLHKNLQNSEDLINAVGLATSFRLEGIAINLDPRLLIRLQSRCFHKDQWEKWLTETVIRQLHDFAGY